MRTRHCVMLTLHDHALDTTPANSSGCGGSRANGKTNRFPKTKSSQTRISSWRRRTSSPLDCEARLVPIRAPARPLSTPPRRRPARRPPTPAPGPRRRRIQHHLEVLLIPHPVRRGHVPRHIVIRLDIGVELGRQALHLLQDQFRAHLLVLEPRRSRGGSHRRRGSSARCPRCARRRVPGAGAGCCDACATGSRRPAPAHGRWGCRRRGC